MFRTATNLNLINSGWEEKIMPVMFELQILLACLFSAVVGLAHAKAFYVADLLY